ncbi:MAG TPA: protein kinase [Polyangia bacterium]|nr:protein kinase [Polyangia bacterium]
MSCLDDNAVLAFLEGRLSAERMSDAEAHLSTCASCRETVTLSAPAVLSMTALGSAPVARAASALAAPATLERGASVGRYVVLGAVGRGAMGEVYAAFDPELNRKVALKLLRASDKDTRDGRTRLLREAQATAKLQHANVVVVYDVGTFGDSVFIAMEFIEGRTLTGWLAAEPRSRREILDVFLAAGRGLAAAHAAGLVHRDFKPDNVMVGNDGQVRVMDFGLAREASDVAAAPVAGDVPVTSSSGFLALKLTQTGAMVGTPAYMAPEQFAARATDARTDQFSFCVALYEALYGQRPFAGATFGALMESVMSGAPTPPPPKANVPGWIRKVLLRGLATAPEQRFATMPDVLAALEADPSVRRKRVAVAAALAACVVVAALGARQVSGERQSVCRGGAARWASVWPAGGAASSRRDAVHAAFVATGRSYAETAFAGAARLLDEYVGRWTSMYTDACESARAQEQSTEVLDLRMSCLQERLTSASALVDVFTKADGDVVENAVSAAGALPQLDRCANVAVLKAVVRPPEDEPTRKRVEALRAETARLVALRDAGHCREAETFAAELIPRVRAVGYQALIADADVAAGLLANDCADQATGVDRLKHGFNAALAARHDEAAALAALSLASFLADRLGQLTQGREWLDTSRAMLARFDSHPLLDAWYLVSEGMVMFGEGRSAEAVEAFRASIAAKEKILGRDSADTIYSMNNVANALLQAHRPAEAVALLQSGCERLAKLLGRDHPMVALPMSNLGEALVDLHRYEEARVEFEQATAIWRRTGSAPIFLSFGLLGLGTALLGEGRPLDAIAPLEEALELRLAAAAPPDQLADTRLALARALWARPASRDRAVSLAKEARATLAAAQTQPDKERRAAVDAWLAAPTPSL